MTCSSLRKPETFIMIFYFHVEVLTYVVTFWRDFFLPSELTDTVEIIDIG